MDAILLTAMQKSLLAHGYAASFARYPIFCLCLLPNRSGIRFLRRFSKAFKGTFQRNTFRSGMRNTAAWASSLERGYPLPCLSPYKQGFFVPKTDRHYPTKETCPFLKKSSSPTQKPLKPAPCSFRTQSPRIPKFFLPPQKQKRWHMPPLLLSTISFNKP